MQIRGNSIKNILFMFLLLLILAIFPLGLNAQITLSDANKFTTDTGYLDAIVINSDRETSKLKETVVSMSILKPYLIQSKLTYSLSDILIQAPGVSITDGQINIRNGSGWSYAVGSRVNVTYDDIPMLNADDGAVPFDYLPIEDLAGLEVIKSAGSVVYGSSALNGVINLRSAPIVNKTKLKVATTAGQYQIPNIYGLRWGARLPRFGGTQGVFSTRLGDISENGLRRHGLAVMWNALSDDGYRMHDQNRRSRVGFRYEYLPKLSQLRFALAGQAQSSERGSFLLWENYNMPYVTMDTSQLFAFSKRFNLDPRVEWNGKKGWNHKFINRLISIDYETDNGDPLGLLRTQTQQWYGEYKVRKQFFDQKLTISSGLVIQLANTKAKLFGGNRKGSNRSLYTQIAYKSGPWIAEVGARFEHYQLNQATYQRPVYRAGVNRSFGKATYLRSSVGQGFRLPSMAEMFTKTNFNIIGIFPNPNLVPEYGWNAEVGLRQGLGSKNGRIKGYADISLFSMTLNEMMEFTFSQWDVPVAPTFGAGFRSENMSPAQIKGWEFETAGEYRGNKGVWRLLGGYTFSDSKSLYPDSVFATDRTGRKLTFANTRTQNNNILKYRSRHMVRLDLQYESLRWQWGVSSRYQSKFENYDLAFVQFPMNQIIPSPNGNNPNPFLRNSDVPDGYDRYNQPWVFDLRCAYNLSKRWKFSTQITNVFNAMFMSRPCDLRPPRAVQLQCLYQL